MRVCVVALLSLIAVDVRAQEAVLSATAFGKVEFGSTLNQVEGVLNETAKPEDGYGDDACRYVSFSTFPGTLFMVENGVVTRIDAAATISNALDVSVGALLSDVLKTHPEAQVAPHKYDPHGHYLIFPTEDDKAAVVMEIGDGKVTTIRAGLRPSVDYVEGCL